MFSKDGPALNPDGSCALGAATRPPRVRRIGLGPALLSAAVLTFGVFALASGGVSGMHAAFHSAAPAKAGANHALGSQPLAFEPNHGQSDARVRFLTHGHGYSVFFTSQGPVLTLDRGASRAGRAGTAGHAVHRAAHPHSTALAMRLLGANANPGVVGAGALAGRVNYLVGRNRSRWHTDIPTYSEVAYRRVWNGIGAVFYGNRGNLEYDFRLAPHADPGQIALRFAGARSLRLARDGSLVLGMPSGGTVRELAPHAYQSAGGQRHAVASRYVLDGGTVRLRLGAYDHSRPVVVDPTLQYATYLGGSNAGGGGDDEGDGITVDGTGNAYVTGYTNSTNFPHTVGALKTTNSGATGQAFVTKLPANGQSFTYSTYLGGSDGAEGSSIAVDSAGRAYVTGVAGSDFPTTLGGYQTSPSQAVFVSVLSATGNALAYSTYLGSDQNAESHGIAVDSTGKAYVTGYTSAGATFPAKHPLAGSHTTADGNVDGDVFVAKLDPALTGDNSLIYATLLGGTGGSDIGHGIAVDSSGNAYLTGSTDSSDFPCSTVRYSCTQDPGAATPGYSDVFVSKLAYNSGTTTLSLPYSTYLGGDYYDEGFGIAADSTGHAYVTGDVRSSNFPTTSNGFQTTSPGDHAIFVAKFDPAAATNAASLQYLSYLDGASGGSHAQGIAVDSSGHAFVTGDTGESDFPQKNSLQSFNNGAGSGDNDAFVSELDPAQSGAASLLFSTWIGGGDNEYVGTYTGSNSGNAIAVDSAGANTYVTGSTFSPNFPVTPGAAQTSFGSSDNNGTTNTPDAYAVRIGLSGTSPQPTSTTVSCPATTAGTSATCTATVTNTGTSGGVPGGTVAFSDSGTATFTPPSCLLHFSGATSAACQVTYTSSQVGTHTVTAHYSGVTGTFQASAGTTQVNVTAPGGGNTGGNPGNGNGTGNLGIGAGNGSGSGNGNGNVEAAIQADITAARAPKCLSVPNYIRDQVANAPGGGHLILKTHQVSDPTWPLSASLTSNGRARIASAAYSVNGRRLGGTSRTTRINVGRVKIGAGTVNHVTVVVGLSNGKRMTLDQRLVILRCAVPKVACQRLSGGTKLLCKSFTPLRGRHVKVTVTRPPTQTASGSTTVHHGAYTVTLTSRSAVPPGTYAYKDVVTTAHRGEQFMLIRLVAVR